MSLEPGSQSMGEPGFVAIGRIRRPHGLKGEVITEVLTDFPERIKPEFEVYVGPERLKLKIHSVRAHSRGLLLLFEGYRDREQASELRNQWIFVPVEDSPPLPDGEHYHHQLIGINVVTDDNRELGKIVDIIVTGANDVYVVRAADGSEVLLPAINAVILDIDLTHKLMRVHPLPGLLPE